MKSQFLKHNTNNKHASSTKEKNTNQYMLNEWNWKLEQSLMQLRSRINAIENRLSVSSSEKNPNTPIHHASQQSKNPPDTITQNMDAVKELIDNYEKTLHHLEFEYKEMNNELLTLMKKQRSSSVIMRVKGKEIPLEISGIIGGILTIIIAILIGLGGVDLVVSPVFLSIIGCILIGSTLFRSFGGLNVIRSFYKAIL